jgi:hypothetical protein
MQKIGIGRLVRFVLAEGVVRPMIVTNVNNDGLTVNGVVFLDPPRDEQYVTASTGERRSSIAVEFVPEGDQVGSWFWPLRD